MAFHAALCFLLPQVVFNISENQLLHRDEMKQLNRMVTAYLDFAENMTLRHIPLAMQEI